MTRPLLSSSPVNHLHSYRDRPATRLPIAITDRPPPRPSADTRWPCAACSAHRHHPNHLLGLLCFQAIAELKKHVGEGCTYGGYMMVNKVAGNFHFALQKADHHTLMSVFGKREALNVSHVIHSISFGDEYPVRSTAQSMPTVGCNRPPSESNPWRWQGMVNPLQNVRKILDHDSGYFQYYLKVVPTVYEPMGGKAPVRWKDFQWLLPVPRGQWIGL
jgi:hypothetical protein